MNIVFRFHQQLLSVIHRDLTRPHRFAAERVGFIACAVSSFERDGILILAETYHPVADDHYINNPKVGAMMDSSAIRTALEIAYGRDVAMFHVHRHEHHGKPRFSPVDRSENAKFIPDFFKVRPSLPHGAIVLSHDSAAGTCWLGKTLPPIEIQSFSVVGPQVPILRRFS